jgi:hypothetical protein
MGDNFQLFVRPCSLWSLCERTKTALASWAKLSVENRIVTVPVELLYRRRRTNSKRSSKRPRATHKAAATAQTARTKPIANGLPGFGWKSSTRPNDANMTPPRTAYGRSIRAYCQKPSAGVFSRGRTTTALQPIQIGGKTTIRLKVTGLPRRHSPIAMHRRPPCRGRPNG